MKEERFPSRVQRKLPTSLLRLPDLASATVVKGSPSLVMVQMPGTVTGPQRNSSLQKAEMYFSLWTQS